MTLTLYWRRYFDQITDKQNQIDAKQQISEKEAHCREEKKNLALYNQQLQGCISAGALILCFEELTSKIESDQKMIEES